MNINPAIYEQLHLKTVTREYSEDGKKYVITVKYGFDVEFDRKHNQAPGFSITAEIQTKRGRWVSGGCVHDEIVKHFPELKTLIRWHLTRFPVTPMHYVENAVYWANFMAGISQWDKPNTDPESAFKNTIKYGIAEHDQEIVELIKSYRGDWKSDSVKKGLRDSLKRELSAYLIARQPVLSAAFLSDMKRFELWDDPEGMIDPAPVQTVESSNEVLIKTFDEVHGITCEVESVERNPNITDREWEADHYKVTFHYAGKEFSSYFSKGLAHRGVEPSAWEVLENMAEGARTIEGMRNYHDFCDELGYENRMIGQQVYNAIQDNTRNLRAFLGDALFNELLETISE